MGFVAFEIFDGTAQTAEPSCARSAGGCDFQGSTGGGQVLGSAAVEQSMRLDVAPECRMFGLSGCGQQVRCLACFARGASLVADPQVCGG
ncbi:hypothetical protein NS14008_25070 [Nocardia seriolae]|nr:hypothetical protein NS14008_25070 [Nocardia seriolae]PSK26511.1 hypothetical protein C6575_36930 [Nocardia seriolae]RLP21968.1 hypothetical protein D6158_36545 [Nocardia seriolae]